MVIINENNTDIAAITEVTIETFKTLPVNNQTEHFTIICKGINNFSCIIN